MVGFERGLDNRIDQLWQLIITELGVGEQEGVKNDIHVSVLGSSAVFPDWNCGEEAGL